MTNKTGNSVGLVNANKYLLPGIIRSIREKLPLKSNQFNPQQPFLTADHKPVNKIIFRK